MKTMTLNLSDAEMEALEVISMTQELSKTGVIKQALRLYQLTLRRMEAGETMHFSGDPARALQFIGPGFPMEPTDESLIEMARARRQAEGEG